MMKQLNRQVVVGCAVVFVLFILPMVITGCVSKPAGWRKATALEPPTITQGQPGETRDFAWWFKLEDEELTRLIDKALTKSPTIKIAANRVRMASARAGMVTATQKPSLSGNAGLRRTRLSDNSLIPTYLFENPHNTFDTNLAGSLDLDLNGRASFIIKALEERTGSAWARYDHSATLLSVAVAKAYAHLKTLRVQKERLSELLEGAERIEAVNRIRLKAGLEDRRRSDMAESSVASMRARLSEVRAKTALAKNSLAALIGEPPGSDFERVNGKWTFEKKLLEDAVNIPLNVIAKRPEVASARMNAEAAFYMVKSDERAFYPNVNLTALIGFSSLNIGRLFKSESLAYSAGPALHLPILQGGRLKANLGYSQAVADTRIEEYNLAVLEATRDVLDKLALLRSARERLQDTEKSVAAFMKSTLSTELRFKAGLDNERKTLTMRQALLNKRIELALREYETFITYIGLVASTGGGVLKGEYRRGPR